MKLKIYSESKEEQAPVYLKLIEGADGDVKLIACDEAGNRVFGGNILALTPAGKIQVHQNVSPDLGFQLDQKGKVIIYDDA